MPAPSNAPTRWRGRRRKCSCITWALLPRKHCYSNGSQTPSCTWIHRCVLRLTCWRAARWIFPRCGPREFPAICRLFSRALMIPTMWTSSGRCCARTNTGGGNNFRGTRSSSPHRQTVARAVLLSRRGTLAEQIVRSQYPEAAERALPRAPRATKSPESRLPRQALQFFNGLGGFADRGREYVIALNEGLRTPEPWVNVVANPNFGFLVSESGSGFTWSLNSHENQLTPRSNDHA